MVVLFTMFPLLTWWMQVSMSAAVLTLTIAVQSLPHAKTLLVALSVCARMASYLRMCSPALVSQLTVLCV